MLILLGSRLTLATAYRSCTGVVGKMGGSEGRVKFLWGVCFVLDFIIIMQYIRSPNDAWTYLTSWSHFFSITARWLLVYEHEWSNRFFHASSVLLYASLVTFFVVLLVDDTIISKRLDIFELPHYRYMDPDQAILSRSAYDKRSYFDEKGIDDFHNLGLMVTYNNLRHVFPAAAHLVLTYELRTTTLAMKDFSPRAYFIVLLTAFLLPLLHFIMAILVHEGEKSIYVCDPSLPALAMFISIPAFTYLQLNIAECDNDLVHYTSGPETSVPGCKRNVNFSLI